MDMKKIVNSKKETDEDDRDKGWAWVVAFACFVSTFTTFGFGRTKGIYYDAFKKQNYTSKEAAWPFTLMSITMQLSGVMFSPLMYYLTIRKLVIIGSIISALGSIMCYFSTNFIFILVGLGIVNGVGTGIINTCNPVIISMYFKKYITTAMSIGSSGSSVGAFILGPLTYLLIENYGIEGSFLMLGGILLQCLPAACLYRQPKIANDIQKAPDNELDRKDKFKAFKITWRITKNPVFLLIAFTFSVYNLFLYTLQTIIVSYAMEKGIDKFSAVFLISANAIADFVGRSVVGWIMEVLKVKNSIYVMICYLFLGVLSCSLSYLWNYVEFVIVFCAIGVFFGCLRVEQSVLIAEYVDPNDLPIAVGLCNSVIGLTLILQVPLVDYSDHGYNYIFFLFSSLLFLSAFLWLLEPLIEKCQKRNKEMILNNCYD
ncbi:monocarboxylate transporter 12-B-like [Centruroides vittatus]|uniref:monocarboxylate transporter 12-B-like n=1 Tax=Centruroides vittatus TaxID=120091 RepID=UPI00350FE83F